VIAKDLNDCRSIYKLFEKDKVPSRKLPCRMASAGKEHRETKRKIKTRWQKWLFIFLLGTWMNLNLPFLSSWFFLQCRSYLIRVMMDDDTTMAPWAVYIHPEGRHAQGLIWSVSVWNVLEVYFWKVNHFGMWLSFIFSIYSLELAAGCNHAWYDIAYREGSYLDPWISIAILETITN
jgi:hypothetical protein